MHLLLLSLIRDGHYSHAFDGKTSGEILISYSTRDQDFAERLHADLQAKGVRCWFATHDIHGGRKIHEQIDEAIRLHDRLLLILSEHSMSSEWVKTEIAKARKRETKEGKRVLFPVRLVGFERLRDWECFDSDTGKDSAREVREYFIPDFSNWKDHDSYQAGLVRLISDLKSVVSGQLPVRADPPLREG
ncbi:MAG TPA: toll/interleukin-1 receptor domain-containing protein [Terriglobales bacterium]